MAIQGIIVGWANPADLQQHMFISGRGGAYDKVVNGHLDGRITDLEAAIDEGYAYMQRLRIDLGDSVLKWVQVTGATTDSVGTSVVTHTTATNWEDICIDQDACPGQTDHATPRG